MLARSKKYKFVCNKCSQAYTTISRAPMTLVCGHTFCRACIEASTNKDKYVPCSLGCKKMTPNKKVAKNFQFAKAHHLLGDEPIVKTKAIRKMDLQSRMIIEVDSASTSTKVIQTHDNVEDDESEAMKRILEPLNDLTEELHEMLDDVHALAKDCENDSRDVKMLVARQANILLHEVENASRHPIISVLRHQLNRPDPAEEDRRLRESIRAISQEFNLGNQFDEFVDREFPQLNKTLLTSVLDRYMDFQEALNMPILSNIVVERIMDLAGWFLDDEPFSDEDGELTHDEPGGHSTDMEEEFQDH